MRYNRVSYNRLSGVLKQPLLDHRYGVFILLVRLLETSVLVFFERRIIKTVFASFMALMALIVMREVEPWIKDSDDMAAYAGQWVVFFWLFSLQVIISSCVVVALPHSVIIRFVVVVLGSLLVDRHTTHSFRSRDGFGGRRCCSSWSCSSLTSSS